ncbi:penicillin-binding transpeptidase domain-containing protein [Paenibacillus filicis]|uniref:Penicillin-binding transpeptidase domain-containing protein n=1 Tax=Paenibacillus gyeongsangnamensis TaxID=3388067 RepID=A0ABT4QDA4_9BACL|nr:penicillin-binding transpeptidase domain-containing protein [Paenibacillus filicis]MCZ8514660.1 penicillin-binding transpeptidase domain-containing protein [Paenibacillus filicis]
MDNEQKPALKKHRIFIILLLLIGILLTWNLRLFWIQVASARSFTSRNIDLVENSVIQREKGIVLDSGRGDFYDRNGIPLTGRSYPVLTVFPVRDQETNAAREAAMKQIAQILNVPYSEWSRFVSGVSYPQVWPGTGRPAALSDRQAQQIEEAGLADIRVTLFRQRYDAAQTASQVVGYIGQNPERVTRQFTDQFHKGELQLTSKIGNAGLEKTFEPWLQGIGATTVSLYTDATKNPLPGLDARIMTPDNRYYPLKVITTLDSELQRQIEARMDKLQIAEGAVVVLDIGNADTLVMASRPAFQPEHIDLSDGAWSNKALKASAPGSIFKTITATAALEEGAAAPDEVFDCSGQLGQYGFTCWKKDGHGAITLEEAYAESCNIVFAKVAQRLGGAKLEEYARRMGLAQQVGWSGTIPQQRDFRQWDAEEKGQIYQSGTNPKDGGVLVQTAIGQRDVLVSPLQAANLVVTLFHQGKVLSPRVVQEIRFRNDRLYQSFQPARKAPDQGKAIHSATAKRLLGWMEEVVEYGTGRALGAASWSLAGKSGTAEVTLDGGRPGENQWFIGYGPAEHPRYAVAVELSRVPAGQKNKSIPLFREVMDVLAAAKR